MRIGVLGATGRTGRLLVEAAAPHHSVRVLARNAGQARETFAHLGPAVDVVAGDLLDGDSLKRLVHGDDGPVDAVISAAGPVRGGGSTDLQSGARHLVAAMGAASVHRLVWLTGAGVRFPQDDPGAIDRAVVAVMHLVARRTLHDSREAVRIITSSDLDWTIVRAPRLTDGAPSPSPTVAAGVGQGTGMTASRATVAALLLQITTERSWQQASPVVSD